MDGQEWAPVNGPEISPCGIRWRFRLTWGRAALWADSPGEQAEPLGRAESDRANSATVRPRVGGALGWAKGLDRACLKDCGRFWACFA